jgi:hypothetical protein
MTESSDQLRCQILTGVVRLSQDQIFLGWGAYGGSTISRTALAVMPFTDAA